MADPVTDPSAATLLYLLRSGLDRNTVLFIGWFGPRGLASLVFALLALEELGSRADEAVVIVGVTVVLSVLAHGVSAVPLAAWYGNAEAAAKTRIDRKAAVERPTRHRRPLTRSPT